MTSSFDPLVDRPPARYVVGVDLGTTNSAAAYVDTHARPWQVRTLAIPQLVAPGVVEARDTLPSCLYAATSGEAADDALRLPWQSAATRTVVGVYAQESGSRNPGRSIASAKSWLCHRGVDRTADLLPWHGAADVERLSPIAASARVLDHLRAAWDATFPAHPLATQDVVLTLPASFDEIARDLTVQAAAQAQLPRVVLLEEPQAAFYAWVCRHRDDWPTRVRPGDVILVCDIGGGTTDFTLIQARSCDGPVEWDSRDGSTGPARVQFHRTAVGNHLILGGDNLDVYLAQHLERKLTDGGRLPPAQWDVLVRTARRVKEELLSDGAAARARVHVAGLGAQLVGGGLQVDAAREEVRALLVDGFLPRVALAEKPQTQQSGFREFGLPYASDPAITRYLAAFLTAHRQTASPGADTAATAIRPDIVLFNGGFFAAPLLQQRLVEVISHWFRTDADPDWSPRVLDHGRLDLAVAHGAAYFGMVRRGQGVRIAANLARSYYIGIEQEPPAAVCLVPGSATAGETIALPDRTFRLRVSQPVEFPLWVSSVRLTDPPGRMVPIDREQLTPLPPIRTVLRTSRRRVAETLAVQLHAQLTEIGTMELWCTAADGQRSWRLQFDVRAATDTDGVGRQTAAQVEGIVDEATWDACARRLADVFSAAGTAPPARLVRQLADVLQAARHEWPTPLLRRIWDALMQGESGRRKSLEHETRWLNLLGFALRPGYGLAVDDWRVAETWRQVQGKLVHGGASVRDEALILWRRIAGGLSRGQQQALADPLLSAVRSLHHRFTAGGGRGEDAGLRPEEMAERWRLLGSLELLDVARKIELGNLLVALCTKKKFEKIAAAMLWTVGRLGQRVPVYGPLNAVVPAAQAEQWIDSVLGHRTSAAGTLALALMQLARRTDDRYRDVSESCRHKVLRYLADTDAAPHLRDLVGQVGRLELEEQRQIFGESLPQGLRLE